MRVNRALVLLMCCVACFRRTLTEDVESATETNEIIPREAIEKLDFSVRLALLRAIDKLEQEEAEKEKQEKSQMETTQSIQNLFATTTAATSSFSTKTTKDEILEESVAPDVVIPTVQFFTATFDEKNTHEQPLSSFIDHSKPWKKTAKGVTRSSLDSPVVVAESDGPTSTAQSYTNQQTVPNLGGSAVSSNEIFNDQSDEIKFEIRSSNNIVTSTKNPPPITLTTSKPQTTKRKPKPTRPTTTTTTTTTTPRPTHNEDGENIEVVDKQDIKIQEAPLVTAFTVDLDERGSTKKVFPIIHTEVLTSKRVVEPTITKLNVLPGGPLSLSFLPTTQPLLPTQLPASSSFAKGRNPVTDRIGQLNTQNIDAGANPQKKDNFLIERQRQLEQQIYQLKLQAQQQQELIIRQLKILEQQSQVQKSTPNLIAPLQQQQIPSPTVAPFLPQRQTLFQTHPNQLEFSVTQRPSIEFIPSTNIKTVSIYSPFSSEQQLPLNDFPNKFINSDFNKLNNINNNDNKVTPNSLSSLQTQLLPLNTPVRQAFQNIQNLHIPQVTVLPTNLTPTTVQIQQSKQFSFGPTFEPALQTVAQPLELSLFQPLPQHEFQQFQQQQQSPLVPSYVTEAILHQQKRIQQEQQPQLQPQRQQQKPQHHRFFRQESDTGNFGSNQIQIQKSNSFTSNLPSSIIDQQTVNNQNFYRQHLSPQLSNHLQQNAQQYYVQQQQQLIQQNPTPAVNHGINAFGAQSLRYNGRGF